MTKARGCKVISQKRKLDNEKKCEGMNPHTPRELPPWELESNGLLNVWRVIARVKTQWIKEFFIPF